MRKKSARIAPKALPSALTVAHTTESGPVAPVPELKPAAGPKPASPSAPATVSPQPVLQLPPTLPLPPLILTPSSGTGTGPKTVKTTFTLLEPQAKQVCLCGAFNDWSPTATPMKRQADGRWVTTLALAPGRYQYKFVVDGRWMEDPESAEFLPDGHGALNSVIEVRG